MTGHQRKIRPAHRPFWLPASTYYFLAASIALGLFFFVWAMLNDGRDDSPWITAGLLSSMTLIGAVVVREVILRNRRERIFAAQRRLDNSLLSVPIGLKKADDPDKFTIEQNSILLTEIKRKSEAAKVLSTLADSHREVFVLCDEYLSIARRELPNVGVGSPRLAAITKGRDSVERMHRFHMLKWAEAEVRKSTQDAGATERLTVKLENAKKALGIVEIAVGRYPDEQILTDSRQFLGELVVSLRVSNLVEKAKRAEKKGNVTLAKSIYQDALDLITREAFMFESEQRLQNELQGNIDRLDQIIS